MTILKKFSIAFSAFFLAYFGEIAINIACGGESDPYDYYISYFHNNVQGDEYAPFAYSQMTYLYDENEVESEPQINSQEWAKYLDVKKDDVYKVMYKTDSATNAKLTGFDGKSLSELPDSLQQNTYLQGLAKDKAALKYYLFAKSCEPFANISFRLWEPESRDTVAMKEKGAEGLKLASSEKNEFLKLRYAYQAARMFHYGGSYDQCKTTYEKFLKNGKTNSAVKGWALALYAGAVRRSGNPEEAAFLFSKVFATNPERRVQAYKNYYYTSSPVASALKFAKTNNEKANIWAINGFGNAESDLNSLEKVYQYEPKSLLNGALLVREINKLEQSLIKESDNISLYYNDYFSDDSRGNRYKDSIKNVRIKQLYSLRDFAVKIASEKKYPQPELGTLTAAYLSWMENKEDLAANYLAILNPNKLPERLKDQYLITDLLLKAQSIKKGNSFDENNLLPTLKWLDEKRFNENKEQPKERYGYYGWGGNNERFTLTTRNFYQQILAPAYMKMGDTAKAALAMVKGDLKYKVLTENSLFKNMSWQTTSFWQRYLSPKSMQGLSVYKTKAKDEDLTGLLAKALNQLKNDDFYELYGTTYLRTHQYDKALVMFNKLPVNYKYFVAENYYGDDEKSKLYSNPFIETFKDYPKQYTANNPSINKKTFAKEMARFQKLIVSDKKNAALYYYKMANAVYQTGYYGNSWFLISYDWSTYDSSNKPKYDYDNDYKKALTAKNWYLKARSLSPDANFKAKCTFMLAKCTQKQIIINASPLYFGYYGQKDVKYRDFIRANYNNPYFKELKLKYSKTPYYQTAASECSYLGDFIAGK